MQVTIPEARYRLPQLIRSVQAGGEVVIAEGGEPVARLVAVGCALATTIDTGRALGHSRLAEARIVCPMSLQRSPEEIDATIQAGENSWD